jgi:uncharacterized protein YhaN
MGISIRKLVVDGFGIFHDFTLELDPGLTVLWGPNEAGKTTLMAFIRAMFFGFPDGRSRENRYEPLRGGRHGGQLFLQAEGGQEYILTLTGSGRGQRVLRRQGPPAGEADLQELLGGISAELYQNVFAIGLGELERLETLQQDAVANHIYSAGLGLTTTSLPEIEAGLAERARELFAPRGRKPQINIILAQLENIEEEMALIRGRLDQYNQLKASLLAKEEELDCLAGESKALQEEIWHLQALEKAWPSWEKLLQVRAELAGLPDIPAFPVDGVSRLEALEKEEGRLRASLTSLKRELAGLEGEAGELEVDEGLLSLGPELTALEEERALYRERLQQLALLEVEGEELARRWQDHCRILGPGWDGERVQDFDTSLATRAQLDNQAAQLDRLKEELAQVRFRLEQAGAGLARLEEGLEEAHRAWENYQVPPAPTAAPLPEGEGMLAEAEDTVHQLEEAERELRHREEMLDLWQRARPGWPWLRLGLLAAGLIAAFWLLERGQPAAALLLVLGAAGLALALGPWRRLPGEERARQELAKERQKVEELAARLRELSQALAGRDRLTLPELRQLARELEREREARREKDRLWASYQEKRQEWEKGRGEYENLAAEVEARERDWREAWQSWQAWLEERGLPPDLIPRQARDLLQELDRGRELLGQWREKERTGAALREQIQAYQERVYRLLACRGEGPGPVPEDCAARVQEMYRAYQEARQNKIKREGLTARLQEKREEYAQVLDRLHQLEAEIAFLLEQAGAADREDFRLRGEQYQRREELLRQERELLGTLAALSPGGGAEKLEEALGETTISSLQGELVRRREELEELQQAAEEQRQELGQLEERLRNLERAEDLSRLLLEGQVLKNQLAASARKWAAYRITQKLLALARTRYERERQPAVLKAASSYFQAITGGRYSQVWAPLGEKAIYVTRQDGKVLSPGELSRGTAEQLYLALRFGLIDEYSRRAPALPLVLDDVVVNFDPERLSSALQVIGRVAQKQQVLLFTCHPHVVEGVQRHIPGAWIEKLSPWGQLGSAQD